MTKPVISTQIRIQSDPEYWFTVEDFHLGAGCDGLTISSWGANEVKEKRLEHVSIDEELALAIADAIYKLFKKEKQ